MQLSTIEQQVIANMHGLPLEQQQSILAFSLFLINNASNYPAKPSEQQNNASFAQFLNQFLKEVEEEPLDIDTSLFDKDGDPKSLWFYVK